MKVNHKSFSYSSNDNNSIGTKIWKLLLSLIQNSRSKNLRNCNKKVSKINIL